jgi:6-phosphogluconolactonase (cycloisomerase 2 family)
MIKLRMCRRKFAAAAGILFVAAPALAPPLTLTPVGNPVPGVGPVPVTVAETAQWAYAMVADYQGGQVRSLRIDPATGVLAPVGSAPVPGGPSALAISREGSYAVVTTLQNQNVTSLRIDPTTGALTPVGNAPSGGSGPSAAAVTNDGFVLVANQDSDNVGVLKLDPTTGGLLPVGVRAVGDGPACIAVAGRKVLVGHALSNDVHLLNIDRFGALTPIDTQSVGERVTGVAIQKPPGIVIAGTYPSGRAHAFVVTAGALVPLGSAATGGDITDLDYSGRGQLLVTGISPPRLAAFDVSTAGLGVAGSLTLEGISSRTLAIARGEGSNDYAIVNEYNNNRTIVIRMTPE